MAGLVPAIQVFRWRKVAQTWMPATSAGMTTHERIDPNRPESGVIISSNEIFTYPA
jgi:hypothetical protein